jgi:hypothetical protein
MERVRPAHLERADRLGAQIIVSLAAKPGGIRNTYDYRVLSREALEGATEGTIFVAGRTSPRRRIRGLIPCPLRGCDVPTLASAMDHALDRFAAGESDDLT